MFISLTISCSSYTQKENRKGHLSWVNISNSFIQGVDLSYVNQVEDHGGVYKDHSQVKDVFQIFKEKGANLVRLRIWNNPDWIYKVYGDNTVLYGALVDVKKSICRAKMQGMAVNLDFHYSDIWADPEHQDVPKAWKNITEVQVLADSVYQFTYKVMNELLKDTLLPEMVQIGNETNCGFMITNVNDSFPKLSVCEDHWLDFGKVVNAGIKAVRDIDKLSGHHTTIALHVADPKNLDWWFKGVINIGAVTDFDVAGFSYYPHWHTEISFADLPGVVKSLKKDIKKKVMILETGYPYTLENNDSYSNIFGEESTVEGYPISIEGQTSFLIDLTQNMISAGADGVMYWEPAWISSQMKDLWGQGSAWENTSFFDFGGNATDVLQYFSHEYKGN